MARPRQPVGLPVIPAEPEMPLYTGHLTGDLERHLREVGRNKLAEVIFPVSKPSKLPCMAWGLSATRCRMGSLLARNEDSVCHESTCYAKRGRITFDSVQARFEQAYRMLFDPLWVPAAIYQIDWHSDDYWRWFHSGDLQGRHHLLNIVTVAAHTRHVIQWLPTREREVVLSCREQIRELAPNLFVRASGTTVDGPPPTWWPHTSTVVNSAEPGEGVCPSWEQAGKCLDCRNCTDPAVKNVIYRRT